MRDTIFISHATPAGNDFSGVPAFGNDYEEKIVGNVCFCKLCLTKIIFSVYFYRLVQRVNCLSWKSGKFVNIILGKAAKLLYFCSRKAAKTISVASDNRINRGESC